MCRRHVEALLDVEHAEQSWSLYEKLEDLQLHTQRDSVCNDCGQRVSIYMNHVKNMFDAIRARNRTAVCLEVMINTSLCQDATDRNIVRMTLSADSNVLSE